MSPRFEGQTQLFFFSSCRLCSLPRGLAGSQQWSSHSKLSRLRSPNRSPYTRGPQSPDISSLQSVSAGQTRAELSARSGLLSGTVLSSFPLLLMKPSSRPRTRRTGARASTEWTTYFPIFLKLSSVLAIDDRLSRLCGHCHPEKANELKLKGYVHKSLSLHDLGSWILIARQSCHSLQ